MIGWIRLFFAKLKIILNRVRNWDFPPSDPLSHGRDSKPTAPSSSLNYTDLSTYRGAARGARLMFLPIFSLFSPYFSLFLPYFFPMISSFLPSFPTAFIASLFLPYISSFYRLSKQEQLTSHHPHPLHTSSHPTLTPHYTLEHSSGRLKVRSSSVKQ